MKPYENYKMQESPWALTSEVALSTRSKKSVKDPLQTMQIYLSLSQQQSIITFLMLQVRALKQGIKPM